MKLIKFLRIINTKYKEMPVIFPAIGVKAASLTKMATIGSRSLPVISLMRSYPLTSERTSRVLHRLTQLIGGTVLAFSAAAVAHSLDRCPRTGRLRLLITSPEEDIEIGNRMSHSLLSSMPRELVLSSSHPLNRICQRIVDTISIRADLRGTTFNIVVISDSQRNAFALPNGDIVLHAGLISEIKNEDELAGLIAHEMSHSLLRHSSEVVSMSDLARIPSGFLYSAVALTGTGPLSGLLRWLAVEIAQPERLLAELPTSRRLEKEADRVGIDLMVQSGYDANAVLDYWKRQPKSEKYLTVASSHPNNADRLQEIQQYLETKQLSAPNKRTRIKPEEDPETTLEYWIARISSQMKQS